MDRQARRASRCRTGRGSTSANCCASRACSPRSNHPNIVTVITAEKQDNVFFIVMEYVPGETLETIIATRGALDLPLALDYTCQIANAVEHAHKQGVIHRDLRPANVFVTDRGLLKVGDFGTSRFLEIAAHGTTVIGSPPYMAPEQFEGRAVFASDIYSLGVTMYQMLTGDAALRHAVAGRPGASCGSGELVSPPRLRNPSVPKAIDEVVMRALRAGGLRRGISAARTCSTTCCKPGATSWHVRRPPRHRPPAPPWPRRPERCVATRLRACARAIFAAGRFCWNCRKPLPARGARCPFCGESQ